MLDEIVFSIYRYNPEVDAKPYLQTVTLSNEGGGDMMVLAALKKLKAADESLAFRHSCGEGVCGSDAVNVNGKNRLCCITPVSSLKQPIVLRPLPGFPVIRDLVVDMTQFFKQYERIEPFLKNDTTVPTKERLQSPADRAKLDGLYECILCACCTSACPSYWWNPDKFVGPAGLLQASRFIADSRDTAKSQRLGDLEDAYSLYRCRTIMNCADVCPKGLNPAKAIANIRTEILQEGI